MTPKILMVIKISGISGLVIAIFFLGYFNPYILPNYQSISFDAELWKAWEEKNERDKELRWKMSSSLLREKRLVGMQRAEVFALLGFPYSETENEAHYELGSTGIGVQYGVLIINFDQDSHVIKAVRIKH